MVGVSHVYMSIPGPDSSHRAPSFFRYLWNYTGTLALLSLLIGVLGMGVYYMMIESEPAVQRKNDLRLYFSGIYNSAAPEPPVGLGVLPKPMGDSCLNFLYNDAGQLQRVVCMGADGKPCLMPGSRVAEQVVDYDADGRVIAKRNFDAEGKPAADAHGVSSREFAYDAAGHLVSVVTRDTNGKKIVPRMPGYAERITAYDALNRLIEIRHLDGLGNPITNAEGENHVRFQYDDSHHTATRTNYENGVRRNNASGIAVEQSDESQNGLVRHKKWLSEKGTPAHHPDSGASSVLSVRSIPSFSERSLYFAADDSPVKNGRCYSEHLMRTDAEGLPAWELYNSADGKPCVNPVLGYAEHAWEYSDDGKLRREYFWDAAGKPSPCYEKRYSRQGDVVHVLSLHTDGATRLEPCKSQASQ